MYVLLQEHFCFLLCWGYLGASLLVMIEEFAVIWLSLAENYVFVAVSLGTSLLFLISEVDAHFVVLTSVLILSSYRS